MGLYKAVWLCGVVNKRVLSEIGKGDGHGQSLFPIGGRADV